jgi:spoIIIJ-associated protein
MEEAEPEDRSEETDEVDRLEGEEDGSESGAMEDLVEAAERGLQEILAFARLDLEYEVSQGDGQLDIELRGPDRDRLLEDRGNLILSIQHVLPRLIRGYSGRSIPCHVDSENFHETRRVELKEMAEEVAAEVRQSQRPRTLPPMNPAERRIIHVALADDKEVKTESQGRGFFKRVTISPAMRRPRGFDRYSR